MLKIKDDVDFEELKKLGFELNYNGDYDYDCNDNTSYIVVFTKDEKETDTVKRQICLISGFYGDFPEYCFGNQLDILYKLFGLGIVEII